MFRFTEQSKSMQMSLFPGEHFKLNRTSFDRYFGEGLKVWSGRVEGFEDGFATLVADKGRVIDQIQYGSRIYRISPLQSGLHVITELSAENMPSEETVDHFVDRKLTTPGLPGVEGLETLEDEGSKGVFSQAAGLFRKLAARPDRIKVLTMYTPSAKI